MISEVSKLTKDASSISSYFHHSGLRTKELKLLAKEKQLNLASFPSYYEVRWTEFTANLFNAILKSWHALVLYFGSSDLGNDAKGHYDFLTNKDNLNIMTFLADVLDIFSRFQKNLQRDDCNLVTLNKYIKSLQNSLQTIENKPLLGGWVEALQIQISEENPLEMKGIKLYQKQRRTTAHNLYVSDRRDAEAVKHEIVLSLSNFLEKRFKEDDGLMQLLEDFIHFELHTDLRKIHELIASDLSLLELDMEFQEVINLKINHNLKDLSILDIIKRLISANNYPTLVKIFARIAAAKPHSADIERLISCNNILKSSHRNSFSVETENLYMYVYFNMPPLESWDPRPAILQWMQNKGRRDKEHPKAKQQDWFLGIFNESSYNKKKDCLRTKKIMYQRKSKENSKL